MSGIIKYRDTHCDQVNGWFECSAMPITTKSRCIATIPNKPNHN